MKLQPFTSILSVLDPQKIQTICDQAKAARGLIGELNNFSKLALNSWSLELVSLSNDPFNEWCWPLKNGGVLSMSENYIKKLSGLFMDVSGTMSLPGLISAGEIAAVEVFFSSLLMEFGLILGDQLLGGSPTVTRGPRVHFRARSSKGSVIFSWFPSENAPSINNNRRSKFDFSMGIAVGFIPFAQTAQWKENMIIYTGWEANSHNYWIGAVDTWLPVSFSTGYLKAVGDWHMKPLISDKMPMDIVIEVGRIRLRGEELDSLVEGGVIPLGIKPKGQVNLVYDNRIVGRGELLVAGDELAIKLISTPDFQFSQLNNLDHPVEQGNVEGEE
jgi:Type III flagellar switch regulator (C-ring) FliN C-term